VLDIGTAPKEDGSLSLLMFDEVLGNILPGVNFKFEGIDVSFPMFKMNEEGRAVPGNYKFDEGGRATLGGITYLDAHQNEKFNIGSEEFKLAHRYHFIFLSKVLQQLKEDDEVFSKTNLEPLEFIDKKSPQLVMTPIQKKAVLHLLRHLEIGGVLFIEPFVVFRFLMRKQEKN